MRGACGANCWDRKASRESKVGHCSLLVNMISVSGVLALGLFWSALGTEGDNLSGLRRLQREFGSDEERHSLEKSELSKRSAGLNEQTCTALHGVESTLQNSTHSVSDLFRFILNHHNNIKLSEEGK